MNPLLTTLSLFAALAVHASANGQSAAVAIDQNSAFAAVSETPRPASPLSTEANPTVVVRGVVKSPEGFLPGAVVHLNGTRTYVVTSTTGDFELTVPKTTTTVEVTCSFAGYRDSVQILNVKAAPKIILLDKPTELPPPDRSAETGWW